MKETRKDSRVQGNPESQKLFPTADPLNGSKSGSQVKEKNPSKTSSSNPRRSTMNNNSFVSHKSHSEELLEEDSEEGNEV